MINGMFDLIDGFENLKVLVIGEAMLDTYLKGSANRVCPEAPVPVVDIEQREDIPGGGGNTAANLVALGAKVNFISVIGDDPEGKALREALEARGISTELLVVDASRRTLAKHRVMAGDQMVVRYDQGSVEQVRHQTEKAVIKQLRSLYPAVDAVIISDYGYGIMTPRVIEAIEDLQKKHQRMVAIDSKRLWQYRRIHATVIKPNYFEAVELLHLPKAPNSAARLSQITGEGKQILDIVNADIAAVTLDQDGAVVFEREKPVYRIFAREVSNSRVAGAGDTFISAMALALAQGAQSTTASELASAAASIVIEKTGTSVCYSDELKSYFAADEKMITDIFQMAARVAAYKRQGMKIVFTNGCFDILHSGHISYLNQAKNLGDILVIGLNSDDSVRRLKGPTRPINPLEDRMQVLAALSCVDHIIPFDGDMPLDLVQAIKPDVYVKGGDYTIDKLPEAKLVQSYGGDVQILPYIQDRSTTGMISKITRVHSDSEPCVGC